MHSLSWTGLMDGDIALHLQSPHGRQEASFLSAFSALGPADKRTAEGV